MVVSSVRKKKQNKIVLDTELYYGSRRYANSLLIIKIIIKLFRIINCYNWRRIAVHLTWWEDVVALKRRGDLVDFRKTLGHSLDGSITRQPSTLLRNSVDCTILSFQDCCIWGYIVAILSAKFKIQKFIIKRKN